MVHPWVAHVANPKCVPPGTFGDVFRVGHFVPAIVYVHKCTLFPANLFFRLRLGVEIWRAATGTHVRAFQTLALAKSARA